MKGGGHFGPPKVVPASYLQQMSKKKKTSSAKTESDAVVDQNKACREPRHPSKTGGPLLKTDVKDIDR